MRKLYLARLLENNKKAVPESNAQALISLDGKKSLIAQAFVPISFRQLSYLERQKLVA